MDPADTIPIEEPPPVTDDLNALFAYNRWADARLLDACRSVSPDRYAAEIVPGWASLRSTVAHLAGAADVWIRRFLGEEVTSFVAEADLPAVDDAARLLASSQDRFERLVAGLSADELATPFSFKNIRGQTMAAPRWAVLRHVVNHATYHRGQAASKLKRLGVEPPVTDFVYWVIEQAPPPG